MDLAPPTPPMFTQHEAIRTTVIEEVFTVEAAGLFSDEGIDGSRGSISGLSYAPKPWNQPHASFEDARQAGFEALTAIPSLTQFTIKRTFVRVSDAEMRRRAESLEIGLAMESQLGIVRDGGNE